MPSSEDLTTETNLAIVTAQLICLYIARNKLKAEAEVNQHWVVPLEREHCFLDFSAAPLWPVPKQSQLISVLQAKMEHIEWEVMIMHDIARYAKVKKRLDEMYAGVPRILHDERYRSLELDSGLLHRAASGAVREKNTVAVRFAIHVDRFEHMLASLEKEMGEQDC